MPYLVTTFKSRETKPFYFYIQLSKKCLPKQKPCYMTKIFEFNHGGEKIRSVAIFNFEKSKCSVMIMPYIHKEELGSAIVITRDSRNWISEAPIAYEYHLTYLNILNELDLLMFNTNN
jgi:hypothetical protein